MLEMAEEPLFSLVESERIGGAFRFFVVNWDATRDGGTSRAERSVPDIGGAIEGAALLAAPID